MKNEKKIISSIDIGTFKVCVIIANYNSNNQIEILGTGNVKSTGMKKGIIININDTVDSINNAIKEAENQSGEKITSCIIGFFCNNITLCKISNPNRGNIINKIADKLC